MKKTTAIILSGGKGTRTGSAVPKQYIEIGGEPLLSLTLRAFQNSSVDRIVIAAAEEYLTACEEIAKNCGCTKLSAVILGGKERYDSVLNCLRYLGDKSCEGEIVLIHDGARPFIRPEVIDQIILETEKEKAAIAGVPCTDTIKILDEKQNIISTTERSRTWAAQTPQGFMLDMIRNAYEKICGGPDTPEGITDDAMVYQLAYQNAPVRMVFGGYENIKITTARDLAAAENLRTENR